MRRPARLNAAKSWLTAFKGRHVVKSYARWFGVDLRCALTELRLIGAQLDPAYVAVLEKTLQQRRRTPRPVFPDLDLSDEDFAYIAGYTEGGAPFGITWEEIDADEDAWEPGPGT